MTNNLGMSMIVFLKITNNLPYLKLDMGGCINLKRQCQGLTPLVLHINLKRQCQGLTPLVLHTLHVAIIAIILLNLQISMNYTSYTRCPFHLKEIECQKVG